MFRKSFFLIYENFKPNRYVMVSSYRTGIPDVIGMDNATNFASSLTQKFLEQLKVFPLFITSSYPEGYGLVERWNRFFKNMLHHIIREERNCYQRILFLYVDLQRVT